MLDGGEKVKLRQTAALALVGWYLIAPSVYRRDPVHGKPAYAGVNEPMSAWTTFGSYDSAEKCEAARHAQFDGVAPSGDDLDRALYESAANAICLATDDPRLKEK